MSSSVHFCLQTRHILSKKVLELLVGEHLLDEGKDGGLVVFVELFDEAEFF